MTGDFDQAVRRRARDQGVFGAVALVYLGFCLIGGLSGAPGQGLTLGVPSGPFILIYGLIWFSALGLFLLFPRPSDFKTGCSWILLLSMAARIPWLAYPASDDVNRYLWEGFLVVKGISPYQYSPSHPHLASLAQGFTGFAGINHPDITAAYPPLLISFFSLLVRIGQEPMVVKLTMAVLDLAGVFLLTHILAVRKKDLRWVLVYALNPLVLVSFAGEGHGDAVQTVFVLGALCCYDRSRFVLMFVCLGLAFQSKIVSILVLPFFVTRENRRYVWCFAVTALVFYLPFVADGPRVLMAGLMTFGKDYAFNGPIQSLLQVLGLPMGVASLVCVSVFGVVLAAGVMLFRSGGMLNGENDPVSGSLWAMGALLLLSPTVHAWYLCWVLPLALIAHQRSWLMLSLSMGFYYVVYGMAIHYGQWRLPGWAMMAEWLPFGLVFMGESYVFLTRKAWVRDIGQVRTVSVVVPAINEENGIDDCVRQIKIDPAVSEVIVVDGGSTDQTADRARRAGARVIVDHRSPDQGGGRGGQILMGLDGASGDVVAVVHADTRVEPYVFTNILAFLDRNPRVAGGAVGTVFDEISLRMKVIEVLNSLRASVLNMSFGDQIQFFRREPVARIKLFPGIPLMEDVEFSLRLPCLGKTAYLFGESRVSSRRWKKQGFSNVLTVLGYVGFYLIQRTWKTPDALSMYRNYYDK